jgi:hypothetical protein
MALTYQVKDALKAVEYARKWPLDMDNAHRRAMHTDALVLSTSRLGTASLALLYLST